MGSEVDPSHPARMGLGMGLGSEMDPSHPACRGLGMGLEVDPSHCTWPGLGIGLGSEMDPPHCAWLGSGIGLGSEMDPAWIPLCLSFPTWGLLPPQAPVSPLLPQHRSRSQSYRLVSGGREPRAAVLPEVWEWGLRYSRQQRERFRNPAGAALGTPSTAEPQPSVSQGSALGGLLYGEGTHVLRETPPSRSPG